MKKRQKQSLAMLFADALAMHEATLQENVRDLISNRPNPTDSAFWGDDDQPTSEDVLDGSVATIPIHGMMTKRGGWWRCGSDHWAMIIENLTIRMDVDTVVIDLDTGGGQVAGTERLADAVWKARQAGKMTIAVVNEFCASAGLWVASQCEHIVMPNTGNIGSLGVYTMHFDDTKFLSEQWGIEKSVIYRGKYKAIDERPLDEDGKADMQRWIDAKYSLFIDAVARGRGLPPDEVMSRWGDSRLFSGSEAVSNGLADEVGTLQDVLDSLKAGRGGRVKIETPAESEDPEDEDPEEPEEGDPQAMKLNAQGQILDSAGKVLGTIADLQLDAAAVSKHFAAQSAEIAEAATKKAADAAKAEAEASQKRLEELVAAVGPEKGLAAWKEGKTVDGAKAALADELAATLKAKEEEIAALKAGTAKASTEPEKKAPVFSATDAGGLGDGKKSDDVAEKDAPFLADWKADKDSCQAGFRGDFKAYAAYRRHAS